MGLLCNCPWIRSTDLQGPVLAPHDRATEEPTVWAAAAGHKLATEQMHR